MAIQFVSSLNKKLYQEYGQRFISEFLKNKGEDVHLTVVFEDGVPESAQGVQGLNALQLKDSEHPKFIKFFGHLYEANGVKLVQTKDSLGKIHTQLSNNYLFDAVRFSFKAFSLNLALKTLSEKDSIAWIDADMRCIAPFSEADIKFFMPKKRQIMSYLGRSKFPLNSPYSECGFLGFNTKHPKLKPFLRRMENLYLSGEIFCKAQWHDSWLWDEIRQEFEQKGFEFYNLSGKAEVLEHPFINTGLGIFFDHLKGPGRKKVGRSSNSDYMK